MLIVLIQLLNEHVSMFSWVSPKYDFSQLKVTSNL